MSEHKVFVTIGDTQYRGRRSVSQNGNRVWIDGMLVGAECDNNGNTLASVGERPGLDLAVRRFRVLCWLGMVVGIATMLYALVR